ncbi:MAG: hypothetical protein NZ455_01000 [Bacteroidia bacterium]|nr:hypothetical protein [Bacteroidia bacterium]MDW8346576.1 hypothetical protein [Bacteroidia bacterium]
MRRASRQAWCEAPRPLLLRGWGRSTVSPQHADLACMSAAKRRQGHAQKNIPVS